MLYFTAKWQMLFKENQNHDSLWHFKKWKKINKLKIPEHLLKAWNNLYTYLAYLWISWGSLLLETRNTIFTDNARWNRLHPACEFLGKGLNLQHKEEINAFLKNNHNEAWQAGPKCARDTVTHRPKIPSLAAGIRQLLSSPSYEMRKHGCAYSGQHGAFNFSHRKKSNIREANGTDLCIQLESISFFPGIFSSPFQNPNDLSEQIYKGKKKFNY